MAQHRGVGSETVVDVVFWLLLAAGGICIAGSIALGLMATPKGTRGFSRLVWVHSYEGRWASLRFGLLMTGLALAVLSGIVEGFGFSLGSFARAMLTTVRDDFVRADWLWVIGSAVGALVHMIIVTGDYDDPLPKHEQMPRADESLLHPAEEARDTGGDSATRRALTIVGVPLGMAIFMILVLAAGNLGVI